MHGETQGFPSRGSGQRGRDSGLNSCGNGAPNWPPARVLPGIRSTGRAGMRRTPWSAPRKRIWLPLADTTKPHARMSGRQTICSARPWRESAILSNYRTRPMSIGRPQRTITGKARSRWRRRRTPPSLRPAASQAIEPVMGQGSRRRGGDGSAQVCTFQPANGVGAAGALGSLNSM